MEGGGEDDGSGSNASDGEQWGMADKASLAGPSLTSCCVAQGLGTPDLHEKEETTGVHTHRGKST